MIDDIDFKKLTTIGSNSEVPTFPEKKEEPKSDTKDFRYLNAYINSTNFKELDAVHDKLISLSEEIKSIHWRQFADKLIEALEWDFMKDINNSLVYAYVKNLYIRLSGCKPVSPYIRLKEGAIEMVRITKTLILHNSHYPSIGTLLVDAIDYLENDRIRYSHSFNTTTNYLHMPIFPPKKDKKEPAFVVVCTGRGGGKTYSQMEMMRNLCDNDVYLKCCRPIDLKKEFSEATRKEIVNSILYGDGRLASSEDISIKYCDKGFIANIKTRDTKPKYYGITAENILYDDVLGYCPADIECVKALLNSIYGVKKEEREEMIPKCPIKMTKEIAEAIRDGENDYRFSIRKVIFNNPATIVYWENGDKTVVKCQNGETFDPEKGLAMAISKRALGDGYEYYETFKKYVGKYYKQEMKKSSAKIADMVFNNASHEELTEAIKESKEIIDKKPKKEKK